MYPYWLSIQRSRDPTSTNPGEARPKHKSIRATVSKQFSIFSQHSFCFNTFHQLDWHLSISFNYIHMYKVHVWGMLSDSAVNPNKHTPSQHVLTVGFNQTNTNLTFTHLTVQTKHSQPWQNITFLCDFKLMKGKQCSPIDTVHTHSLLVVIWQRKSLILLSWSGL